MKTRVILLALSLLFLLGWVSTGDRGAVRAAQYPNDLAGGRPGVFRFYPSQEIQADRNELAEIRVGIERLRLMLPKVGDPALRRELQAQLEVWQLHTNREEQRMRSSAGPTAAEVETRLNSIKGARQCGVCHAGQGIGRGIPVSGEPTSGR